MKTVEYGIIGGGVAGISVASFLKKTALVMERADRLGGLSRSYKMNGIAYDLGPHIIFSKNREVLELHTAMIPTNKIRRSNQIFYKHRYVKYPFENDLAALPDDERDYCLQEFLHNPYEGYEHQNMLQFFLKVFGEGITRTYLQPYNEKIWKFDPAMMDTQMVERIPKPPAEDVIKSAKGIPTEGYTHQLYFHYPQAGGFQTMIDEYERRLKAAGQDAWTNCDVKQLEKKVDGWIVQTSQGAVKCKQLINTAPIHEFAKLVEMPSAVKKSLDSLLYNSIHIVMVQVKKDSIGDHFALYLPDKGCIFHRLSKLNFLGDAYCLPDGASTLMAEVTFRPGSYISTLSVDEIKKQVISGLVSNEFIKKEDVIDIEVKTEKYAYVIYDLNHRKNADHVLGWMREENIESAGRFAEFEYLNTDGVVERTLALARRLNQ